MKYQVEKHPNPHEAKIQTTKICSALPLLGFPKLTDLSHFVFWHLFQIKSIICPTDSKGQTTARWRIYLLLFNSGLYTR